MCKRRNTKYHVILKTKVVYIAKDIATNTRGYAIFGTLNTKYDSIR